jgi:O-antigen ligase
MNIERAIGLTSAGGDPDTMAITMVITLPLALLMLGKKTSKWTKLYGIGIFAIYLATIIDTGSRTAFLAFVVFLLLAVFQQRKNLKYLPVVILALPLLWIVIPQQYKARYETVETRDQDESYTNRILSWHGGMKMFLHNPITGIGPDDYTDANGMKYWPEEPKHWLNAHSLYFKLLGELGTVGVLTFFAYVIAVIRMNWKLARRFKKERLDPLVQRFPYACNICLYLLLFTGYTSHNTYRATWYTLGAITAASALLKPTGDASPVSPAARSKRLPAWIPAKNSPTGETVAV